MTHKIEISEDLAFIDNVCLSYRHDFGLMKENEQNNLRVECKYWLISIINNSPKVTDDKSQLISVWDFANEQRDVVIRQMNESENNVFKMSCIVTANAIADIMDELAKLINPVEVITGGEHIKHPASLRINLKPKV